MQSLSRIFYDLYGVLLISSTSSQAGGVVVRFGLVVLGFEAEGFEVCRFRGFSDNLANRDGGGTTQNSQRCTAMDESTYPNSESNHVPRDIAEEDHGYGLL